MTLFWHCGEPALSSKTGAETGFRQPTVNGFAEDVVPKGLAMLVRSDLYDLQGGAAMAVHAPAIPAASAPTLLIGGLLLLIGP